MKTSVAIDANKAPLGCKISGSVSFIKPDSDRTTSRFVITNMNSAKIITQWDQWKSNSVKSFSVITFTPTDPLTKGDTSERKIEIVNFHQNTHLVQCRIHSKTNSLSILQKRQKQGLNMKPSTLTLQKNLKLTRIGLTNLQIHLDHVELSEPVRYIFYYYAFNCVWSRSWVVGWYCIKFILVFIITLIGYNGTFYC